MRFSTRRRRFYGSRNNYSMNQWQGKAIVLFIAIVFLGAGFAAKHFMVAPSDAVTVQGKIVDYDWHYDSDHDRMYTPQFEYKIRGETYRASTSMSSSSKPDVGDTRTLQVSPEDHEKIYETGWRAWLFPFLFIGVGTVMLLIFAGYLIVGRIGSGARSEAPDKTSDGSPFV